MEQSSGRNMDPRLAAISGPLRGEIFRITEKEASVGRETSNTLYLNDPLVSRRHCLIQREGEQFKIKDLDSYNGTFVNGVPVKDHLLGHGDQIRICSSLFLFLLDEAEELSLSNPIQLDERPLMSGSTVSLRIEESRYFRGKELLTEDLSPDRIARDLGALLKISTTINSIGGLDPLHHRLLELIFEVIPADRGAILTTEEEGQDYSSFCCRDKVGAPDQPVRVSRTIIDRVREEETALLSNRITQSEVFEDASSLAGSGAESVLCVPLTAQEKFLGFIYLETSNPVAPFDEDHLHLLTAVAGIAAVASQNARHMEWLKSENRRLQEDIDIEHNMIGESTPMRSVYQFIAKAAPTNSSVLIYGENGTGKELVAHALHRNSPRSQNSFVAINCATLTETLLESELFGHERGAFTGAVTQKKGKLEMANQGTVFLDEIGELAPTLQAKLLRVLQEREFERLGGTRPIKIDIRLIAATNKNLEEAIEDGTFRRDLYYRLNVVSLKVPPLRERREDIPSLAQYFTARFSKTCNRPVAGNIPGSSVLFAEL